jgi:hypothetical protein
MAGFSSGCAFDGEGWTRLRGDLEDLDFCLDGFVFAIMIYDSESSRGDEEMVISSRGFSSPDFGTFF